MLDLSPTVSPAASCQRCGCAVMFAAGSWRCSGCGIPASATTGASGVSAPPTVVQTIVTKLHDYGDQITRELNTLFQKNPEAAKQRANAATTSVDPYEPPANQPPAKPERKRGR